ncbi:hypothetical protein GGR56DRAFT_693637 [Xylariaceae sp. FL0804]|nr:hypothetical protein GGR56DRAFT_693637 [Xylariaceae sp. FL0804]
MAEPPLTIRVAILGGGLAGAALLRGLLKYPHIAADMYEARPAFREEGQAIAVTPVAEQMLEALSPSLRGCLDRAGAVRTTIETRRATGPEAGRRLLPDVEDHLLDARSQLRTVSPQALMHELLRGVPPRQVHTNARIASIAEPPTPNNSSGGPNGGGGGGGVLLTFADGTRKRYDAMVGADGIHGVSRRHVLGHDNGDDDDDAAALAAPEPTGVWSLPVVVPLARAREAMGGGPGGSEFLDPRRGPRQVSWVGDGFVLQQALVDGGDEVEVSVSVRHDRSDGGGGVDGGGDRGGGGGGEGAAEESPWARLFTPGEFRGIFATAQLPPCRGIVNLIQSVYTVQLAGLTQMQHRPGAARRHATARAALVGDAAHASPALQADRFRAAAHLEQALVLAALLGSGTAAAADLNTNTNITNTNTNTNTNSHSHSHTDTAAAAAAAAAAAVPAAMAAYDAVYRPRAERAAGRGRERARVLLGGGGGGARGDGDGDLVVESEREGEGDGDAWEDVERRVLAAVDLMARMLSEGRSVGL